MPPNFSFYPPAPPKCPRAPLRLRPAQPTVLSDEAMAKLPTDMIADGSEAMPKTAGATSPIILRDEDEDMDVVNKEVLATSSASTTTTHARLGNNLTLMNNEEGGGFVHPSHPIGRLVSRRGREVIPLAHRDGLTQSMTQAHQQAHQIALSNGYAQSISDQYSQLAQRVDSTILQPQLYPYPTEQHLAHVRGPEFFSHNHAGAVTGSARPISMSQEHDQQQLVYALKMEQQLVASAPGGKVPVIYAPTRSPGYSETKNYSHPEQIHVQGNAFQALGNEQQRVTSTPGVLVHSPKRSLGNSETKCYSYQELIRAQGIVVPDGIPRNNLSDRPSYEPDLSFMQGVVCGLTNENCLGPPRNQSPRFHGNYQVHNSGASNAYADQFFIPGMAEKREQFRGMQQPAPGVDHALEMPYDLYSAGLNHQPSRTTPQGPQSSIAEQNGEPRVLNKKSAGATPSQNNVDDASWIDNIFDDSSSSKKIEAYGDGASRNESSRISMRTSSHESSSTSGVALQDDKKNNRNLVSSPVEAVGGSLSNSARVSSGSHRIGTGKKGEEENREQYNGGNSNKSENSSRKGEVESQLPESSAEKIDSLISAWLSRRNKVSKSDSQRPEPAMNEKLPKARKWQPDDTSKSMDIVTDSMRQSKHGQGASVTNRSTQSELHISSSQSTSRQKAQIKPMAEGIVSPAKPCQDDDSEEIISTEVPKTKRKRSVGRPRKKPRKQKSAQHPPFTFHCPHCAKDFTFNHAAGPATFAVHVKGCKKKVRYASSSGGRNSNTGSTEDGKKQRTSNLRRSRRGCQSKPTDAVESKVEMRACRKSPRCKNISAPIIEASSESENDSSSKSENDSMGDEASNAKKESSSSHGSKKTLRNGSRKPKGCRSSYLYFANAACIKEEFKGIGAANRSSMIGQRWREMTSKERKPYDELAKKDLVRYRKEKAEYQSDSDNSISAPNESSRKPSKDDSVAASREVSGKPSRDNYASRESSRKPSKVEKETTSQTIRARSSYPYAPMGQLWLDKSFIDLRTRKNIDAGVGKINMNGESTLIGRRWVWDEGYFVDARFDRQTMNRGRQVEISLLKSGCKCGVKHSPPPLKKKSSVSSTANGRQPARGARRSERSTNASNSSCIASQLANGQLDPHTLISCEEYELGPEYRFVKETSVMAESVQPFMVRVNPDATFLADLHAHLCSSEIIGLLGGYYSNEEKCIYIQAAFPCKATERADSGQTDVEMDPVGQIYATEAIANHGMSVVGWYHSHPDFQPNPSITDIENQANYQQLFHADRPVSSSNSPTDSPFVGLIVGTYDNKNPTSQSVMRWFHVRPRDTSEGKSINYPMNLKTTNRHYRNMTFHDDNTTENIRCSMTRHGKVIRRVHESRFLSCPISGVNDSEKKYANEANEGLQQARQANATYGQKENMCTEIRGAEIEVNCMDKPAPLNPAHSPKDEQVTGANCPRSQKGSLVQCLEICSGNGSQVQRNAAIAEVHSPSNRSEDEQEPKLSLIATGDSPLLLSESLFARAEGKEVMSHHSARPLYFTEKERSILEMICGTIPDDVSAGIIWFAVEREQRIPPKGDIDGKLLKSPSVPASSRSIFELLLAQTCSSPRSLRTKLYSIVRCLGDKEHPASTDELNENDVAIFHNIDVMLGHYAPKSNRINPFTTWSGAGDKGNISKDFLGPNAEPWADFYLTTILKMKAEPSEDGRSWQGGVKIKRGHKIASCLLKWARIMQIGATDHRLDKCRAFPCDNSRGGGLRFDHEHKLYDEVETANGATPQHCRHIYFVSEVMRLLAARWRECGARSGARQALPRRRGRPTSRLQSLD
ncbi:hypothetical protein ACHAWF_010290 [Thalassiosira exigua]